MDQLSLHPEDVKAALRKKYGTVMAFELRFGLPSGSTRDVLRGRTVTRTAKAVAHEVGVSPKKLIGGIRESLKRDDSSRNLGRLHRLSAGVR